MRTGRVRKGDRALGELNRLLRDTDLGIAMDDLVFLRDSGALAGVAEIIRERRRQVEAKGRTLEHDARAHSDGWLVSSARCRLAVLDMETRDGTAGYPEAEEALRKAGALLAAEIDRLNRLVTPEPESPDGG